MRSRQLLRSNVWNGIFRDNSYSWQTSLLEPVGACRQCLVHIEGQPKPPASCTTTCTDGMVVHTQLTSPVAEKAQRGSPRWLPRKASASRR